MTSDSPLRWIRKHVFGVNQSGLAEIAGISRPRVSRYETGADDPPFKFLRTLRQQAKERGLTLKADWFFEAPKAPSEPASVPDDIQ